MGASGGKGVGNTLAGGFRNDVFGTTDQADASQNAALQQQAAATRQQQLGLTRADQMTSQMSQLASASPQELSAYGQTLEGASQQLQQQQALMDSIHPAVMEASNQILKVLQGGQTGIGNAVGMQRNAQRAQLINSLQAQYGPGAESTSIGQKALQQFDMGSATMQAQGQGTTLSNLMGVVDNQPNINSGLAGLSNAGANFGGIQQRQMGAVQSGGSAYLNALAGSGGGVIGSAGADQTSQLIKSGAQRQFFDNWSNSSMKFGQQMGGMGMGQASGGGGGGSGGSNNGWQSAQGGYGGAYNQQAQP